MSTWNKQSRELIKHIIAYQRSVQKSMTLDDALPSDARAKAMAKQTAAGNNKNPPFTPPDDERS